MSLVSRNGLRNRPKGGGRTSQGDGGSGIYMEIGLVVGVVTTENTPTQALYERSGKTKGTVFCVPYKTYFNEPNLKDNIPLLLKSKLCFPFYSGNQDYPLIGETVLIIHGLSFPVSQTGLPKTMPYYIGPINAWNSVQQNALNTDILGDTYTEVPIRPLLNFEGDRIYQGRNGNGLRFGTTVKSLSNLNGWSTIGSNGDPITILTNGYEIKDQSSPDPIVEDINTDKSSIYLTKSQKIPLQPGSLINNSLSSPISINNYTNPQIILNSDRIVINSKQDSIILRSKDFIDLSSDNKINLNSKTWIHLESNQVLLGNSKGKVPTEPVLLGNETVQYLRNICEVLAKLGESLQTCLSTAEGSPIPSLTSAGCQLFDEAQDLKDNLEKLKSKIVFTS